jgi:hypothetical protein
MAKRKDKIMGKTVMGAVVSLDGFIADDNDDVRSSEFGLACDAFDACTEPVEDLQTTCVLPPFSEEIVGGDRETATGFGPRRARLLQHERQPLVLR